MNKFYKNYGVKTKNKPIAQKKKISLKKGLTPAISAALVFCLLTGLLPVLTGCSGGYPAKGTTVTETVQKGKDTKIGGNAKTGWEITVPDGVMEGGTTVTMKVLSAEEAKSYRSSDFTLYGTPIEVSGDGAHGVWFAAPVPVTIKIPKEHLKALAAEELFFATYDNGVWRYFMPTTVNLKDGTATFSASHFSLLGFGKPSEAEQIKTFATTYAADEYDRLQKKAKLSSAVGKQLDELFKSIGIDSTSARDQLVKDAVTYLESAAYDELLDETNPVKDFAPVDTLMRMADAAQAGEDGKQEFNDKALELYTKAIAFGVEKSVNANKTFFGVKDLQTGYVDKTAKAITVLGGLGTAAGAFAGGDKKAGFEAIGNMLTGLAGPKAQLLVSTLNYAKEGLEEAADAAQAYWTQAEIEEAYRLYTKPNGDFEGDFDGIFSLKGNAEALMNIRIVKAHCEKYGMDENDLSSTSRDVLVKNAWKGLRDYFEERKAAEPEIAKLRQNEEAFIAELKKQGLLAHYDHRKYFGIDKDGSNYDVATRLQRLYAIRDAVLGCVDPDKRADMDNARLVRAIGVWITQTEKKDKAGFFKYLRETGLYEESFTTDPTFAWVLVETKNENYQANIDNTNKGGVYEVSASASPGSYTSTWKYVGESDDYPDPDVLHGESYATQLTLSVPPNMIKDGEMVHLDFNLTFTEQNLSYYDGSGSCRADWGNVKFKNTDGKSFFEIYSSVKYKEKNVFSVNGTISAVIPAGYLEGDREELWTGGTNYGTYYVYEWKQIS